MEHTDERTPCMVHDGTVTLPRDMIRALETIEGHTYRQMVDGETMAEGRAALVKIMCEPESATILVNGCLFLNVLSFRYLNFTTDPDGDCVFELVGDGMTLELIPVEEPEGSESPRTPARLLEAEALEAQAYLVIDDDEDDDR